MSLKKKNEPRGGCLLLLLLLRDVTCKTPLPATALAAAATPTTTSSIRLHWRPALLLTQAAAEPATAVARPLSMGPNGFPSSQIIAFNFE